MLQGKAKPCSTAIRQTTEMKQVETFVLQERRQLYQQIENNKPETPECSETTQCCKLDRDNTCRAMSLWGILPSLLSFYITYHGEFRGCSNFRDLDSGTGKRTSSFNTILVKFLCISISDGRLELPSSTHPHLRQSWVAFPPRSTVNQGKKRTWSVWENLQLSPPEEMLQETLSYRMSRFPIALQEIQTAETHSEGAEGLSAPSAQPQCAPRTPVELVPLASKGQKRNQKINAPILWTLQGLWGSQARLCLTQVAEEQCQWGEAVSSEICSPAWGRLYNSFLYTCINQHLLLAPRQLLLPAPLPEVSQNKLSKGQKQGMCQQETKLVTILRTVCLHFWKRNEGVRSIEDFQYFTPLSVASHKSSVLETEQSHKTHQRCVILFAGWVWKKT